MLAAPAEEDVDSAAAQLLDLADLAVEAEVLFPSHLAVLVPRPVAAAPLLAQLPVLADVVVEADLVVDLLSRQSFSAAMARSTT
jgi:hypothetical protein